MKSIQLSNQLSEEVNEIVNSHTDNLEKTILRYGKAFAYMHNSFILFYREGKMFALNFDNTNIKTIDYYPKLIAQSDATAKYSNLKKLLRKVNYKHSLKHKSILMYKRKEIKTPYVESIKTNTIHRLYCFNEVYNYAFKHLKQFLRDHLKYDYLEYEKTWKGPKALRPLKFITYKDNQRIVYCKLIPSYIIKQATNIPNDLSFTLLVKKNQLDKYVHYLIGTTFYNLDVKDLLKDEIIKHASGYLKYII